MNKHIKFTVAAALLGGSLLSFALGASAAEPTVDAAAKLQEQAQNKSVPTVRIQPETEGNCLALFTDLYLELLEQQYELKWQAASGSSAADNLIAYTVASTSSVKPEAAAVSEQALSGSAQKAKATSDKGAVKAKPATKTKPVVAIAAVPKEAKASAQSGQIASSAGNLSYSRVLTGTASAYSASAQENGGYAGKDYFGNALKVGSIAVDPSVIPLGSKVFITGYSYNGLPANGLIATAVDTGSAIKGTRVDIFAPGSQAQVSKFGFQSVKIYLLK